MLNNRLNIQTLRVVEWRSRTIFLILFFMGFSTLVGEVAQAGNLSKRTVRQEVSFEEILAAERRLSDLGYWTGPIDGTLDSGSRHALIAFQKVEGRKRTGKLTRAELQALLSAIRPLPKYSGYAHVEIDQNRQVLFIVDETGTVAHILPVCTGNEPFHRFSQISFGRGGRARFRLLGNSTGGEEPCKDCCVYQA